MRIKVLFTILILVSVVSTQVFGQDTVYVFEDNVPELNTHKFVPIPMLRGPFLNSAFAMRMGVEGTEEFNLPLPDFLPDSIKGPVGSLLFVNLGLSYNQKIKDWISFYVRVNIAVRSGTQLGTLLYEGVNTMTGGETGVMFNLLKNEKHQLSGSAMISNYSAAIINVGQFVRDIIDGNPDASLTQSVPALSVGLGADYAFGLTNVTGLTATAQLLYGESITRGRESLRYRLGMAWDFNWADKGVPIGMSVAYMMRSTADFVYVDNKIGHTFGWKLAYMASPSFVLGLEVTSSLLPIFSVDNKISSTGAMININYYFN